MTRVPSDRQYDLAVRFNEMHSADHVLQLVNAWDATSARIMAAGGAPAIGTTSFGVALGHGYPDGQQLPWAEVCIIAEEIVEAVDVPVTIDIEAGYGDTPDLVEVSVGEIIGCGAVGVNIEDSVPGHSGKLFPPRTQAARLSAARRAAERREIPLFINARCDVYFGAEVAVERRLAEVLERARLYAASGADGLFLPGLSDLETLEAIAHEVTLPINVMVGSGAPTIAELAAAGVRRTSLGGEAFIAVVGTLQQLTDRYFKGQTQTPLELLAAGVALFDGLIAQPANGDPAHRHPADEVVVGNAT